jgi:hypothetical protein
MDEEKRGLVMKFNLVQLTQPLTSSPTNPWKWKADGKLHPPSDVDAVSWARPWRTANLAKSGYDCRWEHQILHDIIFRQQAVPAKCMECYKVVLFLDALSDVYLVEALQQAGTYPGKVGAETRSGVKGRRFGGYWYCNGIEEGQARYDEIKKWCLANLTPNIPRTWKIILKRGCTEFEQHMGRSDKWVYTELHAELEALATERIVFTPLEGEQPDVIVENVHAQWEEWNRLTTNYVEYQKKEE